MNHQIVPQLPFRPDIFAGKVFFITGAGRGMARSLALKVSSLGARVALCDLVAERAQATAKAISAQGGNALAFVADVGNETETARAISETLSQWQKIDVLMNVAGSYGKALRKTHETPVEEWDHVFSSNVKGTFLTAKHIIPHMAAAGGGCIVNFASNAGRTVSPLLGCSYTAAKTAVIGITRHLSREYAASGIRVNTIAPGPVDGERVNELLSPNATIGDLEAAIPLGRLANNDEIIDVAIFLASDAARYMTGAILDVSGGLVLA